jgi:hypothetical protein
VEVPQDDLPADGDLVVGESEGHGLYGQRVVDPRSEIDRPDHHVIHGRGHY